MKKHIQASILLFTTLIIPRLALAASDFDTVLRPGQRVSSYEEWIKLVWAWAMGILIPLSVLIFTAAGIIYMTSEGDSNRVGIAKKMIIGVLSGVGLLILGRLLLIIIFGDAATGGWYF